MNEYQDIINLNHYELKYHERMSIYNRSAQFAPFAALTGYSEAVRETSRLTDNKIEIDEDLKNFIDIKLQIIEEHIKDNKETTIIYFEKDNRKDGGKYIEHNGLVKRIDKTNHLIIFKDNFKINLDTILDIKSEFINI